MQIDTEIIKEDQKEKNIEHIKWVAQAELKNMQNPFWFLGINKSTTKEYPFIMGPFHKVHYQE